VRRYDGTLGAPLTAATMPSPLKYIMKIWSHINFVKSSEFDPSHAYEGGPLSCVLLSVPKDILAILLHSFFKLLIIVCYL